MCPHVLLSQARSHIYIYLNQNSQAVKKRVRAPKKVKVKKDVKSKVAAKKWLVNGKNFNYDNSSEFALPPPLGFGTKFT